MAGHTPDKQQLVALLLALTAKELRLREDQVDTMASFSDLGMDSLSAMYILDALEHKLKVEINPLLFWEHPTIDAFASQLVQVISVRSSHP